ncbi:hypothetical protein D3Y59_14310 [Hymenobacter oligotrophus]|uniref:Phosphatase PAP2 family protein n=1 Tax=Hymenobacter oligotrophus TaxID=2319843 RepID=A0A3B7RFP6_9BACT|nr:hypothetical protein [Hymenobacter oligotrophus]AYA38106.1 hypothetical protein D3Y59_14310 [Hymenobacter oligotrophus]
MKNRLAFGLSAVFHPLLVPTYLVLMLAYGMPTALLPLATEARWQLTLWVWLLTFWLPGLGTWLLYRAGRISSVELYERRQRPVPLLLTALGFGAATALLGSTAAYRAPLLLLMLGSITLAVVLTLGITLRWKISAHGVGMGGALGLLLLLVLGPYPIGSCGPRWLLAAGGVAAAVSWARLALRAHTPAQVAAGLGLGAAVALGAGWLV